MRVVGLVIGCALWAAAGTSDTLLIRGADVYPVSGPVQKAASLLIRDGKIAEIGEKVVAPKGVRVVDARGLRVYPGVIDSATQLGLAEIEAVRETVDTGELGEYMPQLRALASVNPDSEHFGVVRVNGVTSAIAYPAGSGGGGRMGGPRQVISGQAALIHTAGWTWEEMAVRPAAAMWMRFPTVGRGSGGGMPDYVAAMLGEAGAPGTYTEMLRTYREEVARLSDFFEQAKRYQKAKAAGAPGLERNLKYEAVLPVLEGKLPVAVSAEKPRAIHDAIEFAEKQNIKIVILEPRELGNTAEELKKKNIPVVFGKVLALPDSEDDAYDQAFVLPEEAHKAGVKFAFGSFDNQFVRNLPYQAATAVAFGLPPEEALKAITINAAEIWGVADQVGSIETGKLADLMVTTGDPLEIQTQIKHVYVRGKEVELTNRQTRLNDKYLNRQ